MQLIVGLYSECFGSDLPWWFRTVICSKPIMIITVSKWQWSVVAWPRPLHPGVTRVAPHVRALRNVASAGPMCYLLAYV